MLGALAVPVAVGIGVACMVLAAHLPLLSTIPASVYGFASIAGLILLGKDMSPMNAIVPTIGSIILGAGFGWLSEMIRGKLAKSRCRLPRALVQRRRALLDGADLIKKFEKFHAPLGPTSPELNRGKTLTS